MIEGMFISGDIGIVCWWGVSIDKGDPSAVVDDWQIGDDLILSLGTRKITFFVLSLCHCSHLDGGEVFGV